jgi:PAS domain S-box-containing protein
MRLIPETNIKNQLVNISMVTTAAALLLASLLLSVYDLAMFRRSLSDNLSAEAKIIGFNSAAALAFNSPKDAEETLSTLRAEPNIIAAVVYRDNGTMFAQYSRDGRKGAEAFRRPLRNEQLFELNRFSQVHPIIVEGETIGSLFIQSDLMELRSRMLWHGVGMLAVLFVVLPAAYMLLSRLQRQITEPLFALAHLTETVTREKNYSVRAPVFQQDELRMLSQGFNTMLEQIQKRDGELEAHRGQLENEVTERTLELKRSEEFILNILSSVDEAFVVIDRDYRIISANKAYSEQSGKALKEITGRHCYEISHHAGRPCHELEQGCTCKRTFDTGEPSVSFHTHVDDKGNQIQTETKTYAMKDESGKVSSVIEIINDITERKKLEDQLRQAQKMEAIGQLAGGIAHDFNNILTAIIGYGHITLMKMSEDDPLKLNVEHILESADRAANLTQGLLAFSRKQVIDKKAADLNLIVKKVEKFLQRIIGEDIEINLTLLDEPLTVFIDAGQIEQVLMNLATNARDAMPMGGRFAIETALAQLDHEFIKAHGYGTLGRYAVITMTDSGLGMDANTKKRIFEPFFTTKEVGKGTGLGLAIVYGIIKQHDGYIEVSSEPGAGTTFRIYLPVGRHPVEAEKKGAAAEHYPQNGSETILLAEDDAHLRKLAQTVLAESGYTVIEAIDGEDAVNQFKAYTGRIDLLLFDLIMPNKNGKEAFDEIQAIKPGTKTMFISGYARDLIEQRRLLPADMIAVSKPISPMHLLKEVREALDHQTPAVPKEDRV